MKHITREDLSCWYELSWEEESKTVLFKLHKAFICSIPEIRQNAPIVIGLKKDFGFKSFNDFSGNFGFNESWVLVGDDGDFKRFRMTLPRIKTLGTNKCDRCGGTRKDTFLNRECGYCDGTGKQSVYNWPAAYAASATLSLFSILSRYLENQISHSGPPQLLTIQTITQHGQHGGSLGGDYSRVLCEWLAKLPVDGNIAEVEIAMASAYRHMFGMRYISKHDFRAVHRGNAGLHIRCPGDACELHGARPYSDNPVGEGHEFVCHNVDSPLQQLTFIAGLAALHDLARKEMKA